MQETNCVRVLEPNRATRTYTVESACDAHESCLRNYLHCMEKNYLVVIRNVNMRVEWHEYRLKSVLHGLYHLNRTRCMLAILKKSQ